VTSSHVKNLTAQTWWSTMTASHSSFIEVPSTGLWVCASVGAQCCVDADSPVSEAYASDAQAPASSL